MGVPILRGFPVWGVLSFYRFQYVLEGGFQSFFEISIYYGVHVFWREGGKVFWGSQIFLGGVPIFWVVHNFFWGVGRVFMKIPWFFGGSIFFVGVRRSNIFKGSHILLREGSKLFFQEGPIFCGALIFFVGRGLIYFWGGVQVFFGSQFHGGSQVLKGLFRGCQFFFQVL